MRGRNWMERFTDAADLSDEPVPGLSLVEIAGEHRVLIENHCGVSEYCTNLIRVKVKFGHVCVNGVGLTLARMTKGQLVIVGRIESVQLLRRCDP